MKERRFLLRYIWRQGNNCFDIGKCVLRRSSFLLPWLVLYLHNSSIVLLRLRRCRPSVVIRTEGTFPMNFRSGCRGRFRKFGKYLPRWVLSFHFNIQSPENEGRFGLTLSDLTVSLISYHTCYISSEKPRRLMDYPLSWLDSPLRSDTVTTLPSPLYVVKNKEILRLSLGTWEIFFISVIVQNVGLT